MSGRKSSGDNEAGEGNGEGMGWGQRLAVWGMGVCGGGIIQEGHTEEVTSEVREGTSYLNTWDSQPGQQPTCRSPHCFFGQKSKSISFAGLTPEGPHQARGQGQGSLGSGFCAPRRRQTRAMRAPLQGIRPA